ncbi:citrate (pro-3S)-lyase subunit beta [Lactiplantibacillus plantarum]|uniref:citrate (pro-3S)-lyase subunit beta n=1 Tax=Lactiplantibacillus plantarum TaxID=1590 RepID=UPI0003A7BE29|nr:citrate (pro-3S)-lyase subunit beta [Lactiplantibacillus plantarum]AGL63623.2 Citrate lyase, beta chain [Lactiplantibacillus plantarum subsp. plantarum P-8]MBR7567125.1 citrate (pro-3S)-lyase subunit beta [Lactiplantibacillus plantarum]MBR7622716.1 citrate (pro-3S)-lyase subunit beta [Lactiplantibacillus plantarum]MBR7625349.1 citrate (pro-3S)-lyase subunit beta [Lactiplantibacillus plantarum]MBR7643482.1 citrate (pro-3S)-lyase subunit beta [Lactiplantibacillus plantarum]
MAENEERLRRTMMFVPGNNPAMVKDAGIYGADSIMFDLEDAVSMAEKDAARVLVYEALKTQDYGKAELVVRINGLDTKYYADDVKAMVKAGIDVIRLPKVESAAMIQTLEKDVAAAEAEFDIPVGTTHLMAAIESAKGVLNAPAIAAASDRMIGIALSAEDYTTDMKTHRYPDGAELEFARNMVLHAARAAGIAAFDTVFTNMADSDGFYRETRHIHQLGFDGKSLVNPRQIAMVNSVYEPTKDEVIKAQKVIAAIEEARIKGSGVISMNGQMVDRPVVLRAQRVMSLAKVSNLLDEEGNYIEK